MFPCRTPLRVARIASPASGAKVEQSRNHDAHGPPRQEVGLSHGGLPKQQVLTVQLNWTHCPRGSNSAVDVVNDQLS